MDGVVSCQVSGALPHVFSEGITPQGALDDSAAPPYQCVDLPPGHQVREFVRDYVFYMPALMYAGVPWPVSPWSALLQHLNINRPMLLLRSPKPLFQGLSPFWQHHVQLLDKDIAHSAIGYFGTLAISVPQLSALYRVRQQTIVLVEPYAIDVPARYVQLPAAVVESTQGSHYFVQWQDSDSVVWAKALFNPDLVFQDTLLFRDALAAGNNPYAVLGESDAG